MGLFHSDLKGFGPGFGAEKNHDRAKIKTYSRNAASRSPGFEPR